MMTHRWTAQTPDVHIASVELAVTDPVATAAWYAGVLGLPTAAEDGVAAVTIGSSVLRLVTAHGPPRGHHHLAFTVPGDSIRAALDWVVRRVDVISVDGGDIMAGPAEWDSESVYFRGPDGSILELIARHRLPPAVQDPVSHAPGPFGPGSLLSISEIGIPVADVPATVGQLGAVLGLAPFGEPEQRFAAVGDDDGLLIVVESGRTWFPTDHDRPDTGPLHVRVSTALDASLDLGGERFVTGHRTP